MTIFKEHRKEIDKILEVKSLSEVQEEMNTRRYNYIGVGYGYQIIGKVPKTRRAALKFNETPTLNILYGKG